LLSTSPSIRSVVGQGQTADGGGPFCAPEAVQKHPGIGEELKAVSPYHIPGNVGIDGHSFVAQCVLYVFPPSSVLLPLLGRIKRLGLKAVMIGPVWPCEQR
jgi:hypothetical protein